MERIILKSDCGKIAIDNIMVYPEDELTTLGIKASLNKHLGWKRIYPKYYKWLEDDSIVEIWFEQTGIVIDEGKGKIKTGTIEEIWNLYSTLVKDITEEYYFEKTPAKISYNNKDLVERQVEENLKVDIEKIKQKQNNNGGASDWYALPKNANTLQDLIEHRNMNGSVKDIFKACYRLGIKTEDELRDLNKMAYYSLREIGRITCRRDYITIAEELMGEQAIENKQNKN